MNRYLSDNEIETITDNLVGTCFNSIKQELENLGLDEEKMTEHDWDEIYSRVFECDACGWWCSMDEANSTTFGLVCDDCTYEDDSDDEDEDE